MRLLRRWRQNQVLVKKRSAELKAVMEGMSFNAFLVFHSKINELMKDRKATLIKYVFLTSEILLNDHQRNLGGCLLLAQQGV